MVFDMQRYFIKKCEDKYRLQDGDFHHVKDVMRIKSGENIICILDGVSYMSTINYRNDDYEIILGDVLSNDNELNKKVIMYQALIKNDNFDFIIQKATELGVTDFYPVIFKRSVVKVNKDNYNSKLERYKKIIKEASEQSRRNVQMKIHNFIDVCNIKLHENELGLFAYENNKDKKALAKALDNIDKYESISYIVGPEGGFENSEVEYLERAGFLNVSLGNRIFRSETASIFGLSLIVHYIEGR